MLSILRGILGGTVPRQRFIAHAVLAFSVFAGIASFCSRVEAQVTFGSVFGTVFDPSGATVAGATVKLTNIGTNETRSLQTSSGGTFAFPNLAAGQYRVETEAAGFKRFGEDGVQVETGVSTRVDAALQVGGVARSVVVTTEAPPLQTDRASLGTTIGQEEVESIPLSGGNVNNMLTLVPGVVAQGAVQPHAIRRSRHLYEWSEFRNSNCGCGLTPRDSIRSASQLLVDL